MICPLSGLDEFFFYEELCRKMFVWLLLQCEWCVNVEDVFVYLTVTYLIRLLWRENTTVLRMNSCDVCQFIFSDSVLCTFRTRARVGRTTFLWQDHELLDSANRNSWPCSVVLECYVVPNNPFCEWYYYVHTRKVHTFWQLHAIYISVTFNITRRVYSGNVILVQCTLKEMNKYFLFRSTRSSLKYIIRCALIISCFIYKSFCLLTSCQHL